MTSIIGFCTYDAVIIAADRRRSDPKTGEHKGDNRKVFLHAPNVLCATGGLSWVTARIMTSLTADCAGESSIDAMQEAAWRIGTKVYRNMMNDYPEMASTYNNAEIILGGMDANGLPTLRHLLYHRDVVETYGRNHIDVAGMHTEQAFQVAIAALNASRHIGYLYLDTWTYRTIECMANLHPTAIGLPVDVMMLGSQGLRFRTINTSFVTEELAYRMVWSPEGLRASNKIDTLAGE